MEHLETFVCGFLPAATVFPLFRSTLITAEIINMGGGGGGGGELVNFVGGGFVVVVVFAKNVNNNLTNP